MPHRAPAEPEEACAEEQGGQSRDSADPRSHEGEDQRDGGQRQENILNN